MADEPLKWEQITPEALVPAIKHIRESFDDSECKCCEITKKLCYPALHPNSVDRAVLAPYLESFRVYRQILGSASVSSFDALVRIGTAPAIFKAYFEAFRRGLGTALPKLFDDTLAIGLANAGTMETHPVEWAKAHLTILIKSVAPSVTNWIKSVCDEQDRPTHTIREDFEEHLFWKTWRAPRLLHMKPLGNTPYDPAEAWTREDEPNTQRLLNYWCDQDFILLLKVDLDKIAGDAYVACAKNGALAKTHSTPPEGSQRMSEARSEKREQMSYPKEFSGPARARIEAEKVKARKLLVERRESVASAHYGPTAQDAENFRKHVLQVFLVFAQEACKLGSQRVWTVDRVRGEANEFLRRFTIEAYYSEGHDKNGRKLREMVSNWGGGLLPDVEREFRQSTEWDQFEDELLKVAEEIAKDDQPSAPEQIASNSTSQRVAIDRFIQEVFQKTGKNITRKDIWTVAGYHDPTEFGRYQRNDPRTTNSATIAFNRVLAMKPEDFIESLEKISPQK